MQPIRFADVCAQGAAKGKRVFIRADLNAPLSAGAVSDDTRIRASVPAVKMALDAGAAVMMTSHLGRPKEGEYSGADSLAPVAQRLAELLGREVPLIRDWIDGVQVAPGEVVVLENCRFLKGEKKNDGQLARRMAQLCDIYVNDAFGTAHRAHASTEGMARFAPVACAGPLLAAEIQALARALENPARPLLAIVGGSKVSTKLTVLRTLAQKVDQLIVGGGIANTFMQAAGLPIGKSLAEPDLVAEARAVMDAMAARGAQVPIPEDVVVCKELVAGAQGAVKNAADIAADDVIGDIGSKTAEKLAALVQAAGTVVWNGPLGVFENDAFAGGTRTVAQAVAASEAFSIAGGGDTLAALARFGVTEKVSYVTTGGGAFLEVLEGKKLPAIAVLQERAAG